MAYRVEINDAAPTVFGSKWTGLNKNLLARLFEVDHTGARAGGPEVETPFTECNMELTSTWESPFAKSSLEGMFSTLAAGLQTGYFSTLASSAEGALARYGQGDRFAAPLAGMAADALGSVVEAIRPAIGRTAMTKLNSHQVFTGSMPLKITCTMAFRAFDDPQSEVQDPLDRLARWASPQFLSTSGSIASAITALREDRGVVAAVLPSVAPQFVGLRYGGYTFAPMVIESISQPLTVPRTKKGNALSAQVQVVLTSIAALDADDWRRARLNKPMRLFSNT